MLFVYNLSCGLGVRLNQQIEDRVQRHATSQLAKNMLKNVHSAGGWALLAEAEWVFADVAFLRSGALEVRCVQRGKGN